MAIDTLRAIIKHRKKIELAELAILAGFSSYEYFRRSRLPLLATDKCIAVRKTQSTIWLEWVCEEL